MTSTMSTSTAVSVATVNAKAFAGLLTDVVLFASKDDTLPALTAVQLECGSVDGTAVIVARATDRYALAEGWVPCAEGSLSAGTVLVPIQGVRQMIAVLKSASVYAQISVSSGDHGSTVVVGSFGSQATVFCLDAEFPRCSYLWPSEHDEAQPLWRFDGALLIRPAAVAKRRKTSLRMHTDLRSLVLVTVGTDFRVIVMAMRDREGIESVYEAPTYNHEVAS